MFQVNLTPKQIEYTQNATHRYNFKVGAVRSGKSYVDVNNVIPMRIIERRGLAGLNFIVGVSKSTIERNVLEPMRERFGERLISEISSNNTAKLFNETVYCLGAEKVSQVSKFRGASAKYIYGDETAEWNEEVFELLKSRLDKEYSCMDGAANPEFPQHWLKKFLDSDVDIYQQHYTIDDNLYLPKIVVDSLKREYAGTVYYDRYILGKWVRAEGAIYRKFADNPSKYLIDSKELLNNYRIKDITIGVDFGGSGSGHAFVASAHIGNYQKLVGLASERHFGEIDPTGLENLIVRFARFVQSKYGPIELLYYDNAEPVLGRMIRNSFDDKFPNTYVYGARKEAINDRIDTELRLIGTDRLILTEDCQTLSDALCEAVWNPKKLNDERLDDGSSDIDSLDAFEYTWERHIKDFIDDVEPPYRGGTMNQYIKGTL